MGTYYKVQIGGTAYIRDTKEDATSFAEAARRDVDSVRITKVTEEKIEIPITFYKAGDRLEWCGYECVLAQVEPSRYTLINIDTGNRTSNPITPKVDHKVSEGEMEQLTGGRGFKVISMGKRKTI
jgi:hypothetical protein